MRNATILFTCLILLSFYGCEKKSSSIEEVSLTITTPADEAKLTKDQELYIIASQDSASAQIDSVRFFIDGDYLSAYSFDGSTDFKAPWIISLPNDIGYHSIMAEAYGTQGQTVSEEITISVEEYIPYMRKWEGEYIGRARFSKNTPLIPEANIDTSYMAEVAVTHVDVDSTLTLTMNHPYDQHKTQTIKISPNGTYDWSYGFGSGRSNGTVRFTTDSLFYSRGDALGITGNTGFSFQVKKK